MPQRFSKKRSPRQAAWTRRAVLGGLILVALVVAGFAITPQQSKSQDIDMSKAIRVAPNVLVVNAPPSTAEQAVPPPAAQAGWRAAVDPATGQLRELEASEAAALSGAATQAPRQITEPVSVSMPDGSTAVRLDESHLSFSVAHKHADGSISMTCKENHAAAEKALASKPGKEVRHER